MCDVECDGVTEAEAELDARVDAEVEAEVCLPRTSTLYFLKLLFRKPVE